MLEFISTFLGLFCALHKSISEEGLFSTPFYDFKKALPLYAAVLHGCQAELYDDVLINVYAKRILRMDEYFSTSKLGAIGADLVALSAFFSQLWHLPVASLREDGKPFVLHNAAFFLRALGRLAESVQPARAALELRMTQRNLAEESRSAVNVSQLYRLLGDLDKALLYAQQSVDIADQSGEAFERFSFRTAVSDALHQAGRFQEAEHICREAEELYNQQQPSTRFLPAAEGFYYCDLLLSQGNYEEVLRRASETLENGANWYHLLSMALDNLSLGRAHLLQSQREPNHPFTESLPYLNRAVDGLRQAGHQEFVVHGLLARAEYYRLIGALDNAQRDLEEAFRIATRGGMGLHLADCHLEYARLKVARSKVEGSRSETDYLDEARQHLKTAKEMIEKMGYHRRDKEVEELERQLSL